MIRRNFFIFLVMISFCAFSFADNVPRADSHAPIGVMGDHSHKQGEWMWSYRYMQMQMDGLQDDGDSLSNQDVYDAGFMVAPTKMEMSMHMLGLMYAPSDTITLMAMAPFVDTSMQLRTMMGMKFDADTSGVGDLKLGGIYTLSRQHHHNWLLNFMLSLPTGSIDEKGVTPMSMPNKVLLPYPMQLGSGTYDAIPGITYTAFYEKFSWGSQAKATLRFGENDRNYRLGDRFEATAWAARPLAEHWSASLRLSYLNWESIEGEDDDLNPMMVPTARTDLQEGSRWDVSFGVNWLLPGNKTNRLALEFVTPLAQDLSGPQLETQNRLILGWQLSY